VHEQKAPGFREGEEISRSTGISVPLTLNGWNEIASSLRQRVPIVKRWEQEEGLPVHRTGSGRDVPVFAFPDEILQWLRLREFQNHPLSGNSSPAADSSKSLHARNVKLRAELRSLMVVSKQRIGELRKVKEALHVSTKAAKWLSGTSLQPRVERGLAGIGRRVIEAQERERSRIGRELHDNINQRLALALIALDGVRKDQQLQPEVRNQLDEVRKAIGEVSTEIQELSHDLHSTRLELLGLVPAMKSLCRELSERLKIEIKFNSQDVPATLPKELSICLFRVLQECLHNALKHSRTRNVFVSLRATAKDIHLIVRDFGVGFDVRTAELGVGLGLTSIRERVRLEHGTVVMKSKAGAGTTIHTCLPYKTDHALAKE
jgi:signal transduction histidine kinase